jgi:hypothetical protein
MWSCPNGHGVVGAEACPRCGARAPSVCHECGAELVGLFCGRCGARSRCWWVEIRPDARFFAERQPHGSRFAFPASPRCRRVDLLGDRILIGRHSRSRSLVPEIDLSEEPEDPAVSREHAELLVQPDGSWTVADLGSANGTFADEPTRRRLPPRIEVPLAEGDSVHVGVWTTLTLWRTQEAPPERGPVP